jgi:hypothetical protein
MRRNILFVAVAALMLATMLVVAGVGFVLTVTTVGSAACNHTLDHSGVSGKVSQNSVSGPQQGQTGSNFAEGDTCTVSAPINGDTK